MDHLLSYKYGTLETERLVNLNYPSRGISMKHTMTKYFVNSFMKHKPNYIERNKKKEADKVLGTSKLTSMEMPSKTLKIPFVPMASVSHFNH